MLIRSFNLIVAVISETGVNATVTSLYNADLEFDLTLMQSDETFDQPEQMWKMESKSMVR